MTRIWLLRLGVLGRYLEQAAREPVAATLSVTPLAEKLLPLAQSATFAPPPQSQSPSPVRPDPAAFTYAVKAAARDCAEGWPGNRRAFVSLVWALVQARHPGWGVTEIEFKAMLIEAHRRELLVLVNADLKDKRQLETVQASAIVYKNTVWHYVRVED